MGQYDIRPLTPDDIPAIMALQLENQRLHPQAEVVSGETYLSPGFGRGNNVICAFDERGRLAGYIPVYPHVGLEGNAPQIIWANMLVRKDAEDPASLRDLLFGHGMEKAKELAMVNPGRATRMMFQYHPSEAESIAYVLSTGAQHVDSAMRMARPLDGEIPIPRAPRNIEVRLWEMESEMEQQAYVRAREEAFPQASIGLSEWQYFLETMKTDGGTTVAAFDGLEVVGAVSAYWYDAENRLRGKASGWTENIFVRPRWIGRGIASSIISRALVFLKDNRLLEAQLDVSASNKRAVGVYERLGYKTVDESRQYAVDIQTSAH